MPKRDPNPKPIAPAPAPPEFGALADQEGSAALENVRHERFALHFSTDGNATQAAIFAGFSKKSAAQSGWDCLNHPKIRARIRYLRMATARELGITRARIRAGLAAIAFADVADIFTTDPQTGDLVMLPVELWPAQIRQAITGMKIKKYEATVDKESGAIIEPAYQILEFKLESRTTALIRLGQDLSMFKKVREARLTDDAARRSDRAERVLDLMAVARERQSAGVPMAATAAPPLPGAEGVLQ